MVCPVCPASNCSTNLQEQCDAEAMRFADVMSVFLLCVIVLFAVTYLLEMRYCAVSHDDDAAERLTLQETRV